MSDLSLLELLKALASASSPSPAPGESPDKEEEGKTDAPAPHARNEDDLAAENAYEAFIRRHEERVKKIRSDERKRD